MHRDLKPENIVIIGNIAKLCDLGFTSFYEAQGRTLYMAPEIIRKEPHNTKSVLWSLGVIFAEIVGVRALDLEQFSQDETDVIFNNSRFSLEFNSVIQRLLKKNPKDRMSPEELLNHPFVRLPKVTITSPPSCTSGTWLLPYVIQHVVNPGNLQGVSTVGTVVMRYLPNSPMEYTILVGRHKVTTETPITDVLFQDIVSDGFVCIHNNLSPDASVPLREEEVPVIDISAVRKFDQMLKQLRLLQYVLNTVENFLAAASNINTMELVNEWKITKEHIQRQMPLLRERLAVCNQMVLSAALSASENLSLSDFVASIIVPDSTACYQQDNWLNTVDAISKRIPEHELAFSQMFDLYRMAAEQATATPDTNAGLSVQLCYHTCITFWSTFSIVATMINCPESFSSRLIAARDEQKKLCNIIDAQFNSVVAVMNAVNNCTPRNLAEKTASTQSGAQNALQENVTKIFGMQLTFKAQPSADTLARYLESCFTPPAVCSREPPAAPCPRCIELHKQNKLLSGLIRQSYSTDVTPFFRGLQDVCAQEALRLSGSLSRT